MTEPNTPRPEAPPMTHDDPVAALLKAVQTIQRARAPGARPKPGASRYALLDARIEAMQKAPTADLSRLAQLVAADIDRQLEVERVELAEWKQAWGDVEPRRRDLADVAARAGREMVHREREDHLGPFTLRHQGPRTRLMLEGHNLGAFEYASGEELFEAIVAQEARLGEAACKLWPRLEACAREHRDPLPWSRLCELVLGPDKKPTADLLYAMGLLRDGALAPGWTVSTLPPSLSQQREAISLPRPSRPGAPDRAFAFLFVRLDVAEAPAATEVQ